MKNQSIVWYTRMVEGYLGCALWTGTDDEGNPLDENYDTENVGPISVGQAYRDCVAFVQDCNLAGLFNNPGRDLDDLALDPHTFGNDFLLSRNGHGSGLWDREDVYGVDRAGQLHTIAKKFGEVNIYVQGGEVGIE